MKDVANTPNAVLILESDHDLAESIRLYLEDMYRVYIIDNPRKIKSYVRRYGIKLVVSDLDVPSPELRNTLRMIRTANPGIKIILMYMFLDEDARSNHSILNEADDHIFKPFDAAVLRCKVERLLTPAKKIPTA